MDNPTLSIDELLEKARNRAAGYGRLYGQKETSDDFVKIVYAQLYEDAPGGLTVPGRDAWVRRQPEYTEAVERKRDAYTDWKRAETYMKLLLVEAEVWRTKSANDRAMDSGHR